MLKDTNEKLLKNTNIIIMNYKKYFRKSYLYYIYYKSNKNTTFSCKCKKKENFWFLRNIYYKTIINSEKE